MHVARKSKMLIHLILIGTFVTDTYSQGNSKHIFKHFTTSCNNSLRSIKAQDKIENNCSCLNVKVFLKELWMLNWHILQYCILQSQFQLIIQYSCADERYVMTMSCFICLIIYFHLLMQFVRLNM